MERKIADLNSRLYDLANKRREKADKAKLYKMPDAYEDDEGKLLKDKRMAALTRRYDDEEEKKKTTE